MSFKDVLNKHYAHTQNSVKKYDVGGKVVTKKGATNDAKKGGYFDGRPHSEGGIKAVNIDNNQPIEVEGGEVVITKRAVSDKTKKEFEGEMMTNKEILSKINESGGGVSFEKGGELNADDMADVAGNTALGAEMQFAKGGEMEDEDYEVTDDDLNFDIDHEILEDGGSIVDDAKKKLFEEFPFFAPEGVKQYDPMVLDVVERWDKSIVDDNTWNEQILNKTKVIEAYSRLLKDIPVENVVERVELSLALNAEQEDLNQMSNYTRRKMERRTSLRWNNAQGQNIVYGRDLLNLIGMAQAEENWLIERPDMNTMYKLFAEFIDYCVNNSSSYLTQWTINFFGNYLAYSIEQNHDILKLNNPDNLPENISRVRDIRMINGKYFLVPNMVFQGLSQTYDKVGFDTFPISYYASNYHYANWFAKTKGSKNNTDGVVLPCILNIRRPLDLSFFYIDKVSPKIFFDAVYIQTGLTPEDLKVNPAFLLPSTPDLEVWIYIRSNQEMLKILKETKIVDGIHMYENNPAVDQNDSAYATEVWITFYSEQTKVLPLLQNQRYSDEQDRGFFTKSQFLKRGGKL